MKKVKKTEALVAIDPEQYRLYARLQCCYCKEMLYARFNEPIIFAVPSFIEFGEVFSSEMCPICESGNFYRFITYIKSEDNKGVQNDYKEN